MVTEIIIVLAAIVIAYLLYKVLKTIKSMVINAIMGLLVLVIANTALGLEIAYSWVVVFTCAIAGVFGAILVILLHYAGIFF
ncbi:SigmaK-factor processing regulatory protein BofA [Methanomethylovorans hollandica DSM 15978]|jgi:dolichyl-phosphate-mannose--protein O-mannosyl transferase|uniref:SigmaK-factor processing regulatory protein BofA n=1 Tax=Methanomethylovorans hollandica (strain DSM 15978 / NBRC 107637 / DMS1) TaxID=867904 RepID=L0KWX3_METHD|nr:pro-sigmaK processing inhibitor BofA family protein [Methanomethylovorans hollandica]AGB48469.1 SigmaK-factor processing regulatory protein BofA [Methanomethylovorans hollandica DSM 15978]